MGKLSKLRSWANFLASFADPISVLGLSVSPKLLSSSISLWIEHMGDTGWKFNEDRIPSPPQNIDDEITLSLSLSKLEKSLLDNPSPGASREHIAALFGYKGLWRTYPELKNQWIPPCSKLPLSSPFVEVFKNSSLTNSFPIKFIKSKQQYKTPPMVAEFREYLKSKEYENDPKVRVDDVSINNNGVAIVGYSQTDYESYLLTNWAIANFEPKISILLRKELCGTGNLFSLDKSLCSNHLGCSALVTTMDNTLVYAVSSGNVISSPEMAIPAVSGSLDFEPEYEHEWSNLYAAHDILREATEEITIKKVGHTKDLRFMSLCRNVLRGGKPELIFNINLSCAYNDLTPCDFEHKKLGSLPALIDIDGNILPGFQRSKKRLLDILDDTKKDGVVISPFLKVCLYYYVMYADLIRTNTYRHRNGNH
jgi:hypothetical protein